VSVELTPQGTRGAKIPKVVRNAMKVLNGVIARGMRLVGMRVLRLTTVGAKTGQSRTVTLGWFPDGDNAWLVVASFGGSAKHPAWYLNMAKNPAQVWIEVNGRRLKVRPESLKGAERADAWRRITAVASNYATYQANTDREIPVVRLTPAD
jgi:deazaflavin-dependent oxidoreductase (nitroreductase family)